MSVIGLDPSLTGTGVATYQHGRLISTTLRGPERMIAIRDKVLNLCRAHRCDLVVMEAPAFSSKGRSVKEIGGIWWVLRVMLYEADIETLTVPPTVLKKYATGKGNANKTEVIQAAWKRLDYDGTDDNIADAMWLRQIGLRHINSADTVAMPQVSQETWAKLEDVWRENA